MYVNNDKKLVFIHIPKNGGTSVVNKLFETSNSWKHIFDAEPTIFDAIGGRGHDGHLEARWLRGYPKYNDYETVSITRNPWSRQLSIYLYWINQMRIIMAGEHQGYDPHAHNIWISDNHVKLITGGFRDWIHEDKTNHMGIGPSYKWADDERKAKHHWFRLESKEELAQLSELLDINTEIGRDNVTQHLSYTKYYEPEMIEIVRNRYEQDIRRFGYEFGK